MQLMQFNYFMERGSLELDADSEQLIINYDRYHDVVTAMLQEVLSIQYEGDYAQADEFVKRWNYWDEKLHGELASRLLKSGIFRRTLVRYAALGD
jgi:hypothetical protein